MSTAGPTITNAGGLPSPTIPSVDPSRGALPRATLHPAPDGHGRDREDSLNPEVQII